MDILDIIKSEHEKTRMLLARLVDPSESRRTFPEVRQMLLAHSQLELTYFYPFLAIGGKHAELLAHSIREHEQLQNLLVRVAEPNLSDEQFLSLMHDIAQSVQHHLDEEERILIPQLSGSLSIDHRRVMGKQWMERRPHLRV